MRTGSAMCNSAESPGPRTTSTAPPKTSTRRGSDPRGRTAVAAADLDGPAAPVETSPMGYAGGIANAAPNGKPRIYDASEGTAIDPLLNKSWDLNSSKTVDLPPTKSPGSSKGGN